MKFSYKLSPRDIQVTDQDSKEVPPTEVLHLLEAEEAELNRVDTELIDSRVRLGMSVVRLISLRAAYAAVALLSLVVIAVLATIAGIARDSPDWWGIALLGFGGAIYTWEVYKDRDRTKQGYARLEQLIRDSYSDGLETGRGLGQSDIHKACLEALSSGAEVPEAFTAKDLPN
ncbi:MAG: hypothetical protein E6Q97_35185 [Desulfurellales bacterium]|nr:MAG: hypothetical protein E6Q97_35185 [Desulfurellales bacterium]